MSKRDVEVQTYEARGVRPYYKLPNLETEFPQILYKSRSVVSLFVLGLLITILSSFMEGPRAGLILSIGAVMYFSAVCLQDEGLIVRPHPAIWRMLKGACIVYFAIIVFLLCQEVDTGRAMLHFVFPEVGKPLPEKSYADDCRVFTPENPNSFIANVWEQVEDIHVLAHLLGWWGKMMVIRDWKVCFVTSVVFEWLEITFRHNIPNFYECWWDHIFFDVFGCNSLGILLGYWTCKALDTKNFNYGMQPTTFHEQLTPFSWTNYNWEIFTSPRKTIGVLYIVAFLNLVDLSNFMLRFTLYIPYNHYLLPARCVLIGLMGLVANHQYYAYYFERSVQKLGTLCWLSNITILVEFLIAFKYGQGMFVHVMPDWIVFSWAVIIGVLGVLLIYIFNQEIRRKSL